jgi:hypothetical protein
MNEMRDIAKWESLTSEIDAISREIDVLFEQMDVDSEGRCIFDEGNRDQLRINENLIRLRHAKSNTIRKFHDHPETRL